MKDVFFPKFLFLTSILILSSEIKVFSTDENRTGTPISFYKKNNYYFQDQAGKPLILIGDYTWETFSGTRYDYNAMFSSLKSRGLNLSRVWLWWGCEEFPPPDKKIHIEPFLREGPGMANDGKPRYNLDKFNPEFFIRLMEFCKAAEKSGVYLQLMMMDAWMIKKDYLWKLNAFNFNNNINGVDGDPDRKGVGTDGKQGFCSSDNTKVLDYQKAYIRKVVETVNGFNNIYFEIANENYYNEEWELTLCDYIKDIEKTLPNQHMTIRHDFPSHSYVVQKWDPELVHKGIIEKRKPGVPLLFDTDWIINKNDDQVRKAAWTAVLSGAHFSYMDDAMDFYLDTIVKDKRSELHRQIDLMASFIKKVNPWELVPADSLVRAGRIYLLANKSSISGYIPENGEVTLDLSGFDHPVIYRWYNPLTGKYSKSYSVNNDKMVVFKTPDKHDYALVIISR